MLKKPFSKITVSEIILDCNINRKTFYYHFKDMHDLLKWMLEQETGEIVRTFDLMTESGDAILFVMNYVEKNRVVLRNIYHSLGQLELKRFFYNDFYDVVRKIVDGTEKLYGMSVLESYKNFLCQFYSEVIAGTLLTWVAEKTPYDRLQMIEFINATFREALPAALREYDKNKRQAGLPTA